VRLARRIPPGSGGDRSFQAARQAFATVPGLIEEATAGGLPVDTDADAVVACELILESLVARRKITRSEGGSYGRAARRPSGLSHDEPDDS